MPAKVNLEGEVFGQITVVRFHENRRNSKGTSFRYWECNCSCGKKMYLPTGSLTTGNTKSCGCTTKAKTHGLHDTRVYQIWADMKTRCDNPDNKFYYRYGGRGIKYQESWKTFENFYEDMKETYNEDLTLDRIDPNGNYYKENCQWITQTLQSRNKSKNSRNKTGVNGVHVWIDGHNGTKYYVASTKSHITQKLQSKHFNVNKYGEELAFFLACEYRDLMIMRLNNQGAGYSEYNGKAK